MDHMKVEMQWKNAPSYRLDSATKKAKKQVVMATGSLLLEKGELPFLLLISPGAAAAAAAAPAEARRRGRRTARRRSLEIDPRAAVRRR